LWITNSLGCFCWPERSFVDCGLRDILDVSVGGGNFVGE